MKGLGFFVNILRGGFGIEVKSRIIWILIFLGLNVLIIIYIERGVYNKRFYRNFDYLIFWGLKCFEYLI